MTDAITQQGADLILTQVVLSGIAAKALALLKQSKYVPWITAETQKLNHLVAATLAALAVVGIHFQFDKTAGVLTITGLTTAAALHLGWEWLRSYCIQVFIGNAAFRTRATPPPPEQKAEGANA